MAQRPLEALPLPLAEADAALLELGQQLQRQGYRFTTVTPQTHEIQLRRRPEALARDRRDVFGWCRRFRKDLLTDTEFTPMDRAKVLHRREDGGGALGAALSLRIVDDAVPRLASGGRLLLYTGAAMVPGRDPLFAALKRRLEGQACTWTYREVDPDVFGEELLRPGYEAVERIAVVVLTVCRHRGAPTPAHPSRSS